MHVIVESLGMVLYECFCNSIGQITKHYEYPSQLVTTRLTRCEHEPHGGLNVDYVALAP